MNTPLTISIQFGSEVRQTARARISYAFRVFAAVYGHSAVEPADNQSATVCLYYGESSATAQNGGLFHIPALYEEQGPQANGRSAVRHDYAGEKFYLACGWDSAAARPDWLGEIFLWLSSSYERDLTKRDDVGRIPYSETVFVREKLSPREAHAARLMAWLQNALLHASLEALPRAPSPVQGIEHLVVCSHDIDFYYTDRRSAWVRLAKNIGAALLIYKSASFLAGNLRMLLQLLAGGRPGKYLPALRQAAIGEYAFGSTMFVVPRQTHRRDPNYRLSQLDGELPGAAENQFSVEVHGSYRSVVEDHSLVDETRELRELIGRRPVGNRQHWLRFSQHQVLFNEVERAGLAADSTLGFSETIGFRNGACFAFPPYNFAEERPCNFLEIPLVIMDGSLEQASREEGVAAQQLADEVLEESRKFGWGGVSILWHNPMEQLSVPAEINNVFWKCAKQQQMFREKWISLEQFLAISVERYRKAGLLRPQSLLESVSSK